MAGFAEPRYAQRISDMKGSDMCNHRNSVLATAAFVLAAATLSAADYREEYLKRLGTLEQKYTRLAEAVPQAKYSWRPADGVRSVSELFLHVANANYGLPRVIGTPPPQDFQPKGFEKSTTDRNQIVSSVKSSFAHLRGAVEKLTAADADKPVKMFGQETTMRGALLMMFEHLSEHLGQGIAYARLNGVVPPWSE